MKFKQLESYFGKNEYIAAALGRSASCIAKWKTGSKKNPPVNIPMQAQLAIQAITEGDLKADKPKKAKS